MEPEELIIKFEATGDFTLSDIDGIRRDKTLRSGLCSYFREHKNRNFAIAMLSKFKELRADRTNDISMNDLMLCGYILGLHRQIEDCLLIWNAKNADFDTYCGFDIQLMVFAGVEPTIGYLETLPTKDSQEALEYVVACDNGGDFDQIDEYFSPTNLPWWV